MKEFFQSRNNCYQCFQPRIATVPDGEWYCPLCVQRACRKLLCLLCAKWNRPNSQSLEPIIVCSKCYNGYHASCFDRSPTLNDPKQWTCPGCLNVSFDLSHYERLWNCLNFHIRFYKRHISTKILSFFLIPLPQIFI